MKLEYALSYRDGSISLSVDKELATSIGELLNKIIKEKLDNKSISMEELEEAQQLLHSYIELKKVIKGNENE